MNQNIIFGLLIVFLILIIILLILLLIFPKETKSLGIGLGICSIITIIIGRLYTKNIDNNSCACGKGECKKCGGINLSDNNLKNNINTLIGLLNVDGHYKDVEYNARLNEVNDLLVTKLKWRKCGTQEDPIEFLNNILGKKTNILLSSSDNNFVYQYILNKENDNYNIDDTRLPIVNLSTQLTDKENFNIIGLLVHSGNKQGEGSGHYIALVRYEDSWYSCDDNICTKLNFNNEADLFNYLKEKHSVHTIRAYLWKKKEKKLKIGSPFGLINYGNICYSNSALQLLLATDLLDNEEVKSEEVKSEEVKSEEVKSEEVKSEEVKSEEVKSEEVKSEEVKSEEVKSEEEKTNNIIKEARNNLPKLQQLQTEMGTLSKNIFDDFKKIPDNYSFLEKDTIYFTKGKIIQDILKIQNKNKEDIKFINDMINNPKLKESNYFYTDFTYKLEEINNTINKTINEINKNIELINQQYNTLKILNDLTSDFIEFEKKYNKNNFSNAEIEKKIIQIKENIQNTFKEFKGKIQIKEDIEEVKKYKFTIEQIKEDIKLVKTQITELSTQKLSPKKESKEDVDTLTASTSTPSLATATNQIPGPAPTPSPATISTLTPSKPAPTPGPATVSTLTPSKPAPTPGPATVSTLTPSKPAPTLVSTMSGKTISSLPVYEFSTGEIEEAWKKELSTSKPKRVENTNTEFDKYLNKLLKENV